MLEGGGEGCCHRKAYGPSIPGETPSTKRGGKDRDLNENRNGGILGGEVNFKSEGTT